MACVATTVSFNSLDVLDAVGIWSASNRYSGNLVTPQAETFNEMNGHIIAQYGHYKSHSPFIN
jgi:hypothetical protein